MPSSNGVSTVDRLDRLYVQRYNLRTWAKDDSVPKHDVVGAWAARDPARRVGRQPLEVTDEAATAVGRLR